MVIWESLSISSKEKTVRRVTYTCVLILCLFFLTTPIAILGGLEQLLTAVGAIQEGSHDFWTSFVPSALLLLLAIVIPSLLEMSSTLAKYNTKARQESATMVKIFIFLFLSTFLLPTFMMTTLAALAVVLFTADSDFDAMSYVFPNSAMFVAFVMQAAIIGSCVELLLPGDIFRRIFRMESDFSNIPHFHFGLSYAFVLTFFSISLFYSSK
jgi:chromate transport protein ChrA